MTEEQRQQRQWLVEDLRWAKNYARSLEGKDGTANSIRLCNEIISALLTRLTSR